MPDQNDTRITLLDPNARAGRTGHRLRVTDAKRTRSSLRNDLGTTREDTPSTRDLLRAAKALSALLFDATEGEAKIVVQIGDELHSPAVVLSTLTRDAR